MAKSRFNYQKVEVTRAIGSTGIAEQKFVIDKYYNRILGARAYVLSINTPTYVNIGLKDRDEQYHQLTPDADWQDNERLYKPLNIENRGQDFFLQTEATAAVSGKDILVVVVLQVTRD